MVCIWRSFLALERVQVSKKCNNFLNQTNCNKVDSDFRMPSSSQCHEKSRHSRFPGTVNLSFTKDPLLLSKNNCNIKRSTLLTISCFICRTNDNYSVVNSKYHSLSVFHYNYQIQQQYILTLLWSETLRKIINPLSSNPRKWSNTLK